LEKIEGMATFIATICFELKDINYIVGCITFQYSYLLLLLFFKPDILDFFSIFNFKHPKLFFIYSFGIFIFFILTYFLFGQITINNFIDFLLNLWTVV